MDVYFDVLQIRDDLLIASGWVTPGIRENKVKIYAVDAAKKEIPCTVMRNCRPDVGVAKYQDARVEDLGMFLEIPCKGRMFVEIVLEEYEPQGTTPVKRQTLPLHIPVVAARGTLEKAKDSLRQVRAKAYTAADTNFELTTTYKVPENVGDLNVQVMLWNGFGKMMPVKGAITFE